MAEALQVIIRWLHIGSVATLVGGALYAAFVAGRATRRLSEERREALWEDLAAAYKPYVYAAVAALVVTGTINILTHGGHSLRYHILLAIKLLLVLHVFAVLLISVQQHAQRRVRMMTGAAISGFGIIAISAYLKLIF